MKKARIKLVSFLKEFSSDHGTIYSHTITLDNGDAGQINAKEQMPSFLGAGETLYYDITPNGKYSPKIKRISDKKQIEQYDKANGGKAPEASNSTEVQVLRDEIEKLREVVKQLVKHTRMVYVAPQSKQPEPVGKFEQEIMNDDKTPF